MGRGWGAAGTSHSSGPDWSLKSITEMRIPSRAGRPPPSGTEQVCRRRPTSYSTSVLSFLLSDRGWRERNNRNSISLD